MAKRDLDIFANFSELVIIHQKVPRKEVGRHVHDEHEFFLPLHSEIHVHSEHGEAKAGPGRMLYVPPKLEHRFSAAAEGSGERLIWLIDDSLWQRHSTRDFDPVSLPSNTLAKELLFYLLIHPKLDGVAHFAAALVESLVESLNACAVESRVKYSDHLVARVSDVRIKRAIEIIENAEHRPFTIAELARAGGLSLRNFNRLFQLEVGLAPKDFIIRRRIAMAKVLLSETNKTITDISLEVGYNSLSKFIGSFKAIEGILPSDYRFSARK
jgi:AraC-like DNA-binding protein